jgi:beta-glucanase (GH16 family)
MAKRNSQFLISFYSILTLLFLLLFPPGFISSTNAITWNLVWSDEFDSLTPSSIDLNKWTPEVGGSGWGNHELQFYTGESQNAHINGKGKLVIKAVREKISQKCWYGSCQYSSARLITKNKFEQTYGRIEARIKLPFGQGIWPAFWMLGNDINSVGWPKCGEIDIMENIGREPSIVHGTIHGPGYSGSSGIGGAYKLKAAKRFSDEFHNFAVEWEPNEIRWYVDKEMYHRRTDEDLPKDSKWVFDHGFFIILNVAVGGDWPKEPDATTEFPQKMEVDYVRVYKR